MNMDILGYIGYSILIFEAITGTMYVRRKAASFPVIIMAAFFVISSVILWILGINKLHSWWLIPTGFALNYAIVKIPAPLYAVAFKDLKGILGEWAKVSFFSPLVILTASLFASIVRIGVSSEKIRNAQCRAAYETVYGSTDDAKLIQAVKDGDLQTVQGLLTDGFEVNAKDYDGKTALGWAAYKGCTEIVKLLLEKGADVNIKTNKGVTALILAAEQKNMEIAKLLLARDADINAKTIDNGQTALMTAAMSGHTGIVRLLLENGAEVNTKNSKGATAMMAASLQGHTEIVKILLGKGADVNAKINNDLTALGIAKRNGHTDIVQLLEKAGAKE